MKNYISIVLVSVLLFASCQYFQDNKNLGEITQIVNDVETIVNKYDNNVQSALDSQKFDYINIVAKAAIDSSSVRLEKLENIIVPANQENFKSAAIRYIKALQTIIESEQLYASLTDTTSISIAHSMDSVNLEAINNTEIERLTYIELLNSIK